MFEVEYLDPKSLVPYANNSKNHPQEQIDELAKAITEFGFDQPIVTDMNNVIIKGHGRQLASLQLGLTLVPVIRRDINPTDAKLLRVSDNEVTSGEWDRTALKAEMVELEGTGYNLDYTGFSLHDREQLMSDLPVTSSIIMPIDIKHAHTCQDCGYRW